MIPMLLATAVSGQINVYLDDLEDVTIDDITLSDGQHLIYDTVTANWTNQDFVAGVAGGYTTNITRNGADGGTLYSQIDGDKLLINDTITATGDITAPNLNIANWDTAYGWGDHAGLYSLIDHAHDYTPSAYANATYAKMVWVNSTFAKGNVQEDDLSDNTSTQLSDTASILYETELDSESELESQLTDVNDVYTNNDFADNSANWDTAYGWGNHAGLYADINSVPNQGGNTTDSPTFNGLDLTGNLDMNANLIEGVNAIEGNTIDIESLAGNLLFTSWDKIYLTGIVEMNGIVNMNGFNLNKLQDLYGQNDITLRPNGDTNDYITFSTSGNVPEINTSGSCDLVIGSDADLKLTSSGDIDIDKKIKFSKTDGIMEVPIGSYIFEPLGYATYGMDFNLGNATYGAGLGFYGAGSRKSQLNVLTGRLEGKGISCTTNKGSSPAVELKSTLGNYYNTMVFAPSLAPKLGMSFNYTTGNNYHMALMCYDGIRGYFEGLRIEAIHSTDAGKVTIEDDLVVEGSISAGDGWTGSLVNAEGDTVTVTNGIITDVS